MLEVRPDPVERDGLQGRTIGFEVSVSECPEGERHTGGGGILQDLAVGTDEGHDVDPAREGLVALLQAHQEIAHLIGLRFGLRLGHLAERERAPPPPGVDELAVPALTCLQQ